MPFSVQFVYAIGTVGGNPVVIDTSSLPDAQVGVPYSATLLVHGGIPPYIWSITGGALPTGLSLSSSGVISGTPTTSGLSTFTVFVLDGPQTGSASTSVTL